MKKIVEFQQIALRWAELLKTDQINKQDFITGIFASLGIVQSEQDLIELFDVSKATAWRWLKGLRDKDLISTMDGTISRLRQCMVLSFEEEKKESACDDSMIEKKTTNIYTDDLDSSLNDLSSKYTKYLENFHMKNSKLEILSLKVCEISGLKQGDVLQTLARELVGLELTDEIEIKIIELACHCKKQFDPKNRFVDAETGEVEVVRNPIAFFVGALKNKLNPHRGNVASMASHCYRKQQQQKQIVKPELAEIMKKECEEHKKYIDGWINRENGDNLGEELLNATEKYHGVRHTLNVAKKLRNACENKYIDIEGYRYKFFAPVFNRAIEKCLDEGHPLYFKYIAKIYITDASSKANYDPCDYEHQSWKDKENWVAGIA